LGIELVAAAVISAIGLTGTAAAIGTVVVGAAIGIGVGVAAQALSQGLAEPSAGADSVRADNRKAPSQNSLPARRMVFGTVQLSGPLFFFENINPFLYVGVAICDGPIDGVIGVTFNGKSVEFHPDGYCTSRPYASYSPAGGLVVLAPFSPYLWASFRNGGAGQQIDTLLNPDAPSLPGLFGGFYNIPLNLPSSFRQQGVATAVFRMHFGQDQEEHNDLYAGSVVPVVTVRGAKIYDPRQPSHNFADPATWVWSDNPALCIAHWLTRRWQYPLAFEEIDWVSFAAAADGCDELVPLKYGGAEKRYRCDGIVSAGQSHFDVANDLLSCCAGSLFYRRGKVAIEVGVARDPVMTLTDRDIAGPIEMRHGASITQTINRIRTAFVSSGRSYEAQNAPVIDNLDYQAADGRVIERTLELPCTSSVATAQRLAKRFLESSRTRREGTLTAGPIAQLLDAGDRIVIETQLPYLNGVFEVREIVHRDSGIGLSLAEYIPLIDDWAPARDEVFYEINPPPVGS
jgi:hypothetical protein